MIIADTPTMASLSRGSDDANGNNKRQRTGSIGLASSLGFSSHEQDDFGSGDGNNGPSNRKNSLTSLDLDDIDLSKIASTTTYDNHQDDGFFNLIGSPPSGPNADSSPSQQQNQPKVKNENEMGDMAKRNRAAEAKNTQAGNAEARRSVYKSNNETLTTTNHLLILSESLEEMARKGEWCDVELSVIKTRRIYARENNTASTKRAIIKLHSIVAMATSAKLKKILTDYKKSNKSKGSKKAETESKISEVKSKTDAINTEPILQHLDDKPGVVRLELHDSCVDVDSMNALRQYMYLGILAISMDTVLNLLDASHYLEMKGSTKLCLDHMKGHIDVRNVLKVLVAAHKYSIDRLKQTALEFIDQEFENIVLEPYWLEINIDVLKLLVCRDTLCVRAEASIFLAVSNWASASSSKGKDGVQENRIKEFEKMISDLSLIRLANMSREELIQVSQTQLVSNSGELRRALYDEAMSRVNQPEGQTAQPKRLRNYTANHLTTMNYAGNSLRQYPLYNLKKCEATLHGHTRAVCAIAVCGNDVLSGSGDGTIRVWSSTDNWECYKVLKGHSNSVVALKVYQDKLLSASPDKTICVWEIGTWKHDRVLTGHRSAVCALAICYNDKLCSGSDDGQLKIWNCRSWQLERTIQAHSHVIWSLTSCREFIISGSSDTTIRVWDSNNWRFVQCLDRHRDEVQALAVSDDTSELFSGSDDGMINVWNTYTWECVRTIDINKRAILSLCVYGPNKVISGLGNGVVKVWNSNSLTSDGALSEHTSCVMAVALFHGKLISASYDKTLKVWGP